MPSQKRFKPLPYELEPPRFAFDPVRLEIEGELARRLVLGQKLTALVAPPGYGKTVLMTKLFHGLRQAGQIGRAHV
jgi:ATP/maltotriose-dependent transcriptional regulator MalT